ncbi:uncharacterized protein [Aegilops tauschii subsp. strangulata]|uniref:uncharacterized protein isoform X1 n=1 Tax=Aegilops tauschii subsp. strangulata TaxID=200361 RepID=UPI001ABC94C5|nr:uncharacterized protein LOC109739777 isoform X1 [Aegilops tauschii subsp. strangulata]
MARPELARSVSGVAQVGPSPPSLLRSTLSSSPLLLLLSVPLLQVTMVQRRQTTMMARGHKPCPDRGGEGGAHLAASPALLEEEGREGSAPRATKRSCPSSSMAMMTHHGRKHALVDWLMRHGRGLSWCMCLLKVVMHMPQGGEQSNFCSTVLLHLC